MPKEELKLNPAQKKAVSLENGPLLVVAGAGTGKTRVIAQRIRYLIQKQKVKPEQILALTFTEKASEEMLHRVDDVMPLGYEEPWIYTFHSFADRLLCDEGLEIGLDPAYRIISEPDQWLLFRKNLFEFKLDYFRPLGNPTKFISAILKFISRLQDENISSKEFYKFAKDFKGDKEEEDRWLELADAYRKYDGLKLENSKMDFGDLIMWTIKLFKERPSILKKYQKQFKHVLIDEFQDTNHAQYELIKLLCPSAKLKTRSLLMVGDDSQSIYKFRGAAVSNILEFKKDYPEAEMVTLLQNYRSSQSILDSAYKLIKNNNPDSLESKLGISKELVSEISKKGEKPEVLQVEALEDEVELVIKKILEILAGESQYTYKDFAILARANIHLDPFVFALRKYGLPYQLVGNRGLYDRDEVRDILSVLKVIVDPLDSVSLYRALNIPSLSISGGIISKMLSETRAKKISLWDAFGSMPSNDSLISFSQKIKEFQEQITKLGPSEFVYRIINSISYLQLFLEEETVENQLCIGNLDLFLNRAKTFEVEYRRETGLMPTIVDFANYIDLMLEAGENPAQAEIQDIDTINLLTVHSSKGLEFGAVFMVNLVGDRFPTRNRKDPIQIPEELIKETLPSGDSHIQEERRLFYVGMTRARKYLFMTFAKDYGGRRERVPSGFLSETGLKIEVMSSDDIRAGDQVGLFGLESGFREPKAEKIKDFEPKFLSYSQFSMYKECPLQYKYKYLLNVPTPESHALSFGTTIHDTLRDFHLALMFGEVTSEKLMEMYERNWIPLGYIDEEHRNLRFESGKKLLKDYYEKYAGSKVKPIAIEKPFNLKIGEIKFFGRIDRIDPLQNGEVEIIDYKTGNAKDQKYVDKDDQVTFYAMGAKEALGMEPKKLSLYFVESGEKISTTRSEEQFESKKKEVKEVVGSIKAGDFKADPGMHCSWCDYKDICPFVYRG